MLKRYLLVVLLMSFGILEASQGHSEPLSLDELYDNYQTARRVKNYSDAAQWAVEIARLDKSGFFVNDIYEYDPLLAQHVKDKDYPYKTLFQELREYFRLSYYPSK